MTEESFDGPFGHLAGGVMWIASMSRPEIADAPQVHDPIPRRRNAASKTLQYLRGGSDSGVDLVDGLKANSCPT